MAPDAQHTGVEQDGAWPALIAASQKIADVAKLPPQCKRHAAADMLVAWTKHMTGLSAVEYLLHTTHCILHADSHSLAGMQRMHEHAFHLEDGCRVSINGIFHDSLPLLHAFLAVLLQVCVPLLECSKVHLLTLPNQRVVLLHTSHQNEQQ